MSVEVRTSTTTIGETGAGVDDREVTTYYLGSEIDGVFVPFASVDSDAVEGFRSNPVATDEQTSTTDEAA